MIELRLVQKNEDLIAMDIINQAKAYLKEQGINQWQTGYPDLACIQEDIEKERGYFLVDDSDILGYLCIDYEGEPAYNDLNGEWLSGADAPYIVVHRLALSKESRGKGIGNKAFQLAAEEAFKNGVYNFRVDTDSKNKIMQHLFQKNGFQYCGTIMYDGEEKIAFEKSMK